MSGCIYHYTLLILRMLSGWFCEPQGRFVAYLLGWIKKISPMTEMP
jgi:hypothetical protein